MLAVDRFYHSDSCTVENFCLKNILYICNNVKELE